MRRAAAGSMVMMLAASTACGGKAADGDSALQADRAAAATDTSTAGAPPGGTAVSPTPATSHATPSGATAARTAPAAGAHAPGGAGPANATSIRPPAGADTLRGIVHVTGGGIDATPVIRPNGGGATVALTGPLTSTLRKLSGTEVWVSGAREATRAMNVERFLVRAVGGRPAMDGILGTRGGALSIMITGEHTEHPIAHPPAALRAHAGQRIWITGPLETGAVAFGVIDEHP